MSRVEIRRLDRDAVLERLGAYARDELGTRPEVEEVVLIGSLSRDDWSARSDADVVVIVEASDRPFRSRSPGYTPSRSPGVPVDVLVYTTAERASWSPRFAREVESGLRLWPLPA